MQALKQDVAIIKTKIDHLTENVEQIMKVLLHAEKSVVSRTFVLEEKIAQLEKISWHARVALSGVVIGVIGFLVNLAITLATRS